MPRLWLTPSLSISLTLSRPLQFWPEPELFDPERFNAENKPRQVPMSYLPFGAGPHNCIGLQIALLQIKLGLIYFLRQHRIELCDRTVDHISFDAKFALLASEHSIYLKVVDCF